LEAEAALREQTEHGERLLERAWSQGSGVRGFLTAVNHKAIGLRFIVTGLIFLVAGGIEALLMRSQLASADSGLIGAEAYNELFTMHGSTMMFLFAVPILEGLGMYFLPLMLGTRDLPFPRLNAFGYWGYLFGGLFIYSSFLFGDVPSEGWFAYTPLSGPRYAPTDGMDFWLLGVTLVELSGIIGAIELIVAFLTRRAPGMTLNRVPVFAWGMLVMAVMVLIAFAVLLTASVMLELERAFGTVFFDPGAGGDPLLWQHLFWFFGHPEVYIMLIPAVAIVSAVVPVFSRRSLAGYPYVVAALLAIGLLSFGLWVHHMFTTGISLLGLSLFAATSFLIAIPSGVQVFAWLATMWRGRPAFRPPLLFVLGFLVIFVAGGVTGVMVAAVPFDWQVHDSYFVVAHFHYVLIGGVLFPVFGGLYYWWPKLTGRLPSLRLGYASFWTMLVGFNVAFFPQHILGFEGMPRRVFTYRASEGWADLNLLSTIGAYVLALGIALTLINLLLTLRRARDAPADPWGGDSLEWAAASPPALYNFRVMPLVADRSPLWHDPPPAEPRVEQAVRALAEPRGEHREVFETGALDAKLLAVTRLPGPSWWPLLTVVAITVGLVGALVGAPALVVAGFAVAIAIAIGWALSTAAESAEPDTGLSLPTRRAGAGWWGTVVASAGLAAIVGAVVFSYLYLAVGEAEWPPPGLGQEPALLPGLGALLALAAAYVAARHAARGEDAGIAAALGVGAVAALVAAVLGGVWLAQIDADPTASAYGSAVLAALGVALLLAAALVVVATCGLVRVREEAVDAEQRVAPRLVEAFAAFVLGAWILIAIVVYLAPRLA
jgi:cytochrome c oxidase subunit I+III